MNEEFGDPMCMICGNLCNIVEYLKEPFEEIQMWCWCNQCKIDTFHKLKNKQNE